MAGVEEAEATHAGVNQELNAARESLATQRALLSRLASERENALGTVARLERRAEELAQQAEAASPGATC